MRARSRDALDGRRNSDLQTKDKTLNIAAETRGPEAHSLPIGLGIDEKRAKVEPTRR
jgi:hypothetical protein